MKVRTLWDPISFTVVGTLKVICWLILTNILTNINIVLFWLDDGFLQTKHVTKILKYCQFADIYICLFLDGIKIKPYYCNTTGWLLLQTMFIVVLHTVINIC
jgi:hypothetical protein